MSFLKHEVKRLNRLSLLDFKYLLAFTFVVASLSALDQAFSKTLREMAIQSSIILAASENDAIAKKCKWSSEKISSLSHALKAEVDEKIQKLDDGDLKIIVNRSSTCQAECTCTIYGLALLERGIKNPTMERLAATETATDRMACIKKIKNYCRLLK